MKLLDPHGASLHFDIQPGMTVVELHAGNGHFTPHLKKHVGLYGIVHSLQHEEDEHRIHLPEKVDRAIAINVAGVANLYTLFSKAYSTLKPHGKLVFIDAKIDDHSHAYATHIAGLAGFHKEKSFHPSDVHIGLIFKKI